MATPYPEFLAVRISDHERALRECVFSGVRIASGFATSEPSSFYAALWDQVVRRDLYDVTVMNGLFMAPHRYLVGEALAARGRFEGWDRRLSFFPAAARLAGKINLATKKLDGLRRLIAHYEERRRRRVLGISGFMGPADNIMVPSNFITRALYPEHAGRNSSRMGVSDVHIIHFPEALALGYDHEGHPKFDLFVAVVTPPNGEGLMSLGPANGANGEIIERIIERRDANLLLYVNPGYPFTRGYKEAANTVAVERLRGLAAAGRLFVVEDQAAVPAVPAGSFASPSKDELMTAERVVNHMEMNLALTRGRAIQVGIGNTGVGCVRKLRDSSWEGREYSEMLEPFTYDLFECGKIKGTHFVERDGTRTMLDGKLVCTFTLGEAGGGFYEKIDNNDAVIIAPASRVVIPEGFYHGLGINNILGIDFQGHVNSGGRGPNIHSGVGGAAMILRGLARGGVGYLCLKSTYTTPEGKVRSSIFPYLPAGTPVSLTGPDLWGGREGSQIFLATEVGVTRLSAKSHADFIRSIISVAHPGFQPWLKRAAWREFRVSC